MGKATTVSSRVPHESAANRRVRLEAAKLWIAFTNRRDDLKAELGVAEGKDAAIKEFREGQEADCAQRYLSAEGEQPKRNTARKKRPNPPLKAVRLLADAHAFSADTSTVEWAAADRQVTNRERCRWVASHLTGAVPSPEECPDAEAWNLLRDARMSDDFRLKTFWPSMYTKASAAVTLMDKFADDNRDLRDTLQALIDALDTEGAEAADDASGD